MARSLLERKLSELANLGWFAGLDTLHRRVDLFRDTSTGGTPVTGTAASAFGWAVSTTGAEDINGTAASAFGWATSATASEGISGTSASAFGWSTSATAVENITGTAASAFGWATAATGTSILYATLQGTVTADGSPLAGVDVDIYGSPEAYITTVTTNGSGFYTYTDIDGTQVKLLLHPNEAGYNNQWDGGTDYASATLHQITGIAVVDIALLPAPITGAGASAFGWTTAASGTTGVDGAAASAFGWATSATGSEDIPGTSATAFGWSDTAVGEVAVPVTGTAASAFGWGDTASGSMGTDGTSAVTFGWATAATAVQDFPATSAVAFGWATAATGLSEEPHLPPPSLIVSRGAVERASQW